MNYEFRAGLSEEEYRAYLDRVGHYSVMQDPRWAKIKTSWAHDTIGLFRDGTMIAGALVLIRRLLPGFTVLYAPRGFVMDYADEEAVRVLTEKIRAYAKEKKAYLVRIDPEIILSDTCKEVTETSGAGASQMALLQSLGYRHKGFAKDFKSYTQPRYYADIRLTNDDGTPMDDAALSAWISRKARKFTGRYTEEKGIFVEHVSDRAAVKEFADMIRHTEKRQGVMLRNDAYFDLVYDAFGDDCEFFFARVDLDLFIENLATRTTQDNNDRDLADALAYKEKYGKTVTMCGILSVRAGDTAYILYGGFNNEIFPQYSATTQVHFEAMKRCRDEGMKTMSLMGVHGDLDDSLAHFKLKFNPDIIEYAGEFELPVYRVRYAVMDKMFPVLRRVFIRLSLLLKFGKNQ